MRRLSASPHRTAAQGLADLNDRYRLSVDARHREDYETLQNTKHVAVWGIGTPSRDREMSNISFKGYVLATRFSLRVTFPLLDWRMLHRDTASQIRIRGGDAPGTRSNSFQSSVAFDVTSDGMHLVCRTSKIHCMFVESFPRSHMPVSYKVVLQHWLLFMLAVATPAVMHSLHQGGSSPRPVQRNVLVDGYIAYTFRPPAAKAYLSQLLSGVTAERLNPIFSQRCILVPRTCLYHDLRDTRENQETVLLDYLVDPNMGTVVPQRLPSPPRTREHQILQTPIFFTQSDGSVGIALTDALSPDGSLSLGANQYNGSDPDNTILMLSWPGYPDYARKDMLRDTRSGRNAIKRLSHQVASFLVSFLENPPAKPVRNDDENAQWTVGPAWKELIMIVGVIQVSSTPNVWMPILQTHGGFFRIY